MVAGWQNRHFRVRTPLYVCLEMQNRALPGFAYLARDVTVAERVARTVRDRDQGGFRRVLYRDRDKGRLKAVPSPKH